MISNSVHNRGTLSLQLPTQTYADGISVVMCCHNSKTRVTETLKALSEQQTAAARAWEIILVDNASRDGTALFAKQAWQILGSGVALTIVQEGTPGLVHARIKGIASAQFAFILFCDDDNWLCPNYLETVYQTLSRNPRVGACGGRGIAHFESAKPAWFDQFAEAFATGPQPVDQYSKKVINLYGAGLGINRRAFDLIAASGYITLQMGRTGEALCSSEDIEMTNALVLLGYQLKYLDGLTFFHFLPAFRTDYAYLQKLFVAFGDDGPVRNLLYEAITDRKEFKWLKLWSAHLALSLIRLIKYIILPPKPGARRLYVQWNKAYIKKLFKMRPTYQEIRKNIAKLKAAPQGDFGRVVNIAATLNYSQQ